MDSDSFTSVGLLILLMIASAFFSSSETAFTSANRIRLKNEAEKGDKKAKRAMYLMDKYDNVLSTILVGNNIVNIASSAIATLLFVSYYPTYGPTIATIVMTVVVLIFGEISPKTIAKENAEAYTKFSAPLLYFLMVLLTPVNWLFEKWKVILDKLFKFDQDIGISEEELLSIVDEAESGGSLGGHEHELIRSAIEFNDLEVSSILTPRVDVVACDIDDSDREIEEEFMEHSYSRILMYDDSIDNVYGVLHEKDFNRYLKHKTNINSEITILNVIKEVLTVPPVMKLSKLLKMMQQNKMHMAVVSDEYGGTIGIVTLEDVLEELVGEIWDESDVVEEEIVQLSSLEYRVLGRASLEKVFNLFHLSDEELFVSNTISGFTIEKLGRVPEKGDSFTYKNMVVEVTSVRSRRVLEVMLKRIENSEL
ncbi:HlyC/CorC family transporter [Lacticigenium naphthae]|uniref:HlyC/CorC family transporter n=1 Tax=Lacticigenium naphthae TaxID=515351 RepID=UPI000429B259|nr:hemolysin family protein [Lacticigenium naphthae]